jgi:hypothetical protein
VDYYGCLPIHLIPIIYGAQYTKCVNSVFFRGVYIHGNYIIPPPPQCYVYPFCLRQCLLSTIFLPHLHYFLISLSISLYFYFCSYSFTSSPFLFTFFKHFTCLILVFSSFPQTGRVLYISSYEYYRDTCYLLCSKNKIKT